MSLAVKLQSLVDGLESTRQAITGKGASLPIGSPLGDYPGAVESIETGGDGGPQWMTPPPEGLLTTAQSLLRGWVWITEVGVFDTSRVTSMSYMFYGCSALESVPEFDTSRVTNMSNMFSGCSALESVPEFDTSRVTNMSNMFSGCSALESVPEFDTSSATNMSNMFYGCSSIVEVELTDCSKVTNASSMFGTAVISAMSLERLILPDIRFGFTLTNTQMSATALNDLFASLGTASGTQTIDIRGSLGAATCDKSIATAKGWTIAG